jgi:hypothetical protein
MSKKEITLTKTQLKHIESFKWLISEDYPQSGRTFLLSVCFMFEALEHSGEEIYLFDHARRGVPRGRMNENIIRSVEVVLAKWGFSDKFKIDKLKGTLKNIALIKN